MRYHLITLGCQMNRSDSERVRTVMDSTGAQWTEHEEEADVLGIVACSVRQKAIDKVYGRIQRWNAWKRERAVVTFVSGCMLPADQEQFLKLFDLVFTMDTLPDLPAMLREYGVVTPFAWRAAPEAPPAPPSASAPTPDVITLDRLVRPRRAGRPVMTGLWKLEATPASPLEAFVPIQNGCDKFCTFCAVPYTRGREVSRPSGDILREVDGLIARGYRTITLLGQNVNSYGRDRGGAEMDFASLLREIGERGRRTDHRFWVYFTSPHPRDMTVDVLETMAAYPCLGKWVHLPLQSGDDKILLRMNRQHSLAQYREIVEHVRRLLPDATLFTDLIVGFSGETDAQFENTRLAVDEFCYHMIYVAMYSPRPGAASSRWTDDIPAEEKLRRLQVINERLHLHAGAANARAIGRTVPVLVTGRDARADGLTGLTEGRIHVRVDSQDEALIGQIVDIHLTGSGRLSLAGELAAGMTSATT